MTEDEYKEICKRRNTYEELVGKIKDLEIIRDRLEANRTVMLKNGYVFVTGLNREIELEIPTNYTALMNCLKTDVDNVLEATKKKLEEL